MPDLSLSRRTLLAAAGPAALAAATGQQQREPSTEPAIAKRDAQRLTIPQLRAWEALGYGMFIHYGMSTFVGNELPDGKAPATTYAPDRLDVDQWVSVARDAGMKYAVLCAKHVAGHCLWPSKVTDYSVAHSTDKTNVVEAFVKACERRRVLPGFYYCSWDNHNRFGSRAPQDPHTLWCSGRYDYLDLARKDPKAQFPAFVTSIYQDFQTAQLDELLTQYGPIAETWIDIPGILGRGYRTFLYEHLARLQSRTVIMMNNGIGTGEQYDVDYAWPSDLIAIERKMPPETGHRKWRTIEGQEYYVPAEICDPIGQNWFYVEGDKPRPDKVLAEQYLAARARGVNLLLDVPPDKHGLLPDESVQALMRLRKNAQV